jgi:hypothetical protein
MQGSFEATSTGRTVTLDLAMEQADRLEEIAAAQGLSVEGYLLTLVEALVTTEPTRRLTSLLSPTRLLRRPPQAATGARSMADEAARRMRADLLAHKERAVEAVTKMNVLRKIVDQHERLIAEAELLALTALGSREPEQGLRRYQESRIHARNLEPTRQQLEEATRLAEDLLAAFKQEEMRVKSRLWSDQPAGLEALQELYSNLRLSPEQMTQQIQQVATQEEWQRQFSAWVLSRADAPAGASA